MTSPIVIDYETIVTNPDGTTEGSIEAWLPEFRVTSMAATDDKGSIFIQGEEGCLVYLKTLGDRPIIAHNIQFEMLVTECRFPGLKLNWYADTMRLAQVFDNGGKEEKEPDLFYELEGESALVEDEAPKPKWQSNTGLSLVKCAARILDQLKDHKKEAHDWLKNNAGIKKDFGGHLDKLPLPILERYNIADTETTYRLFSTVTKQFDLGHYNWRFDHELYLSTCRMLVESQIAGVLIDRKSLMVYRGKINEELELIASEFKTRFADAILMVELERTTAWLLKVKTEKGKENRRKKIAAKDPKAMKEITFNIGSNKQLVALFMGQLGIQPKFFTPKGGPSLKSSVLGQWGEGGNMLSKRRKRLIVLKQTESLLALSARDDRWHISLKAAGAGTGRMAGGNH